MQTVKLNLIPGSVLPVVNVSQYDAHRQFQLVVYEGATAYSLTGKTVEIRGTKPDGNGFAYDATDGVVSVSGNTVTISTTQQMTAVGGQTMTELRIISGQTILGTLNFIMDVEPSALSDDTPISETDIPVIERQLEELVEEIQVYTEDAEAWAVGERDGEPVPSSDPTYQNNAKYYAGDAESDALKAEGYGVGEQNGIPVTSGSPYYNFNANYFNGQANQNRLTSEGYAIGRQNGVPVTSGSPYYHNNSLYYSLNAEDSATNAGQSATNAGLSETAAGNSATSAAADALKSEGFADGEQNGSPVGSGSPYYQNNAKYWRDQAAQYAAGGLHFVGSVEFANIPTTGMVNGDMYNITDDFTTDNRFIEGSGVSVKAGADIAWVDSVSKWDILALGGGSDDYSQLINKPQINSVELNGNKTPAELGLATDAAMIGATASTPGTHGLVPAPAAGDNTKFLRGDGTWAEAGGGGTTIVQIPSVVVGTYTYTGSAQGPTITGLDAAHTVVTGDTATNVGSYTLTIALADPQTMVWSDLTTADKTYSWSIGKAHGAVTLSKNTVVLSDVVPSDTVTISGATGAISISSSDTGVATVSPSTMSAPGGVLTVTGAGAGTAAITVSVAASSNYNATSATISASNTIAKKVYGAVWDGSADASWTRTDDAASFADPDPYYSGMSGTPSSPFDSIQPWAGMVRSTDANAGEVVAIPKFYYKMGYASGTTGLKIQIAPASNGADWATTNGYKVSPAHMDRGDGAGERDVVYVGRYHCASDYKSKTGESPKTNVTRPNFRTSIHALGSSVWQWDYATWVTIILLYLVEYASWDCKTKIGAGNGYQGVTNTPSGSTDNMPYHTGTVETSRSTPGIEQYRYIESLWDVVLDNIDGIYGGGTREVYCIKNPANFGITGGTLVGTSKVNGSYPTSVQLSSASGFDYPILLNGGEGSVSTYIPNQVILGNNNMTHFCVGGTLKWGSVARYGITSNINNNNESDGVGEHIGSRLMILP